MQKKRILVLHGPNLNMLGTREPHIYGNRRLAEIDRALFEEAEKEGFLLASFQSNQEAALVGEIQAAVGRDHGLIINPAAFAHTSVALRDALLLLDIPIIEVHISNIYKREPFRHHSYLADVVTGQITGLGTEGYFLALQALIRSIG